ncbi:hypothetical protein, partial [Acinetobacter baumannii]|uniref:hypothetical protein n=1 Tax=Acinetobacter baumannii TaxID=470 RepID=UPI0026E0C480
TTYPSYALNLAQLGALCLSNLCATKPFIFITKVILNLEKKFKLLFRNSLKVFSYYEKKYC